MCYVNQWTNLVCLVLKGNRWDEVSQHLKNTIVYSTEGNESYVYPILSSNVDCALYLSDFISELSKGTFIIMFKIPWF